MATTKKAEKSKATMPSNKISISKTKSVTSLFGISKNEIYGIFFQNQVRCKLLYDKGKLKFYDNAADFLNTFNKE